MKTYVAECTIADKRMVVVEANSAAEAEEKIRAGRYKRLGRSKELGFLIVGKPKVQS